MAENKIYSTEETITILQHKVKELPLGDNFRLKISRRAGGANAMFSSLLQHVVTLMDATVIHIANPETWLPKLLGGGNYSIAVFAAHEPANPIGSAIHFSYAGEQPHDVDYAAVKAVSWDGPRTIVWPEEPVKKDQPQNLVSMAPSSSSQNVPAPLTQAQGGGVPGGQSVFGQTIGDRSQDQFYAQRERELNEREARIREEAARRENELALQKIRNEHEIQLAKIQAQIHQMNQTTQQPPAPNPLVSILPAIVPLIQTMIQSNNETRMLMIKQQDAAQLQSQQFMQLLLSRPAIDPVFEKLLSRDNGQDSGQMVHSMVDAMSSMTQMSMEAIRTAAEAGGGKQENTGMMVVKEIAKAVEAFATASAGAIKQQQPIRHPLRPPRPVPRQFSPMAPAPQMPVTPNGNSAVAQGLQQPFPQPGQPAAAEPQQLRFDNPVDAIQYMLENRFDPAYVTQFVLEHRNDPTLMIEIQANGGIWGLLQARLGIDWLQTDPGNEPYIRDVLNRITAAGQEPGEAVSEPPEGEDSEDQDEGDDEEYGDGETEEGEEAQAGA